jgi:hypothetical protein
MVHGKALKQKSDNPLYLIPCTLYLNFWLLTTTAHGLPLTAHQKVS